MLCCLPGLRFIPLILGRPFFLPASNQLQDETMSRDEHDQDAADDEADDASGTNNSEDEALLEVLGLTSLGCMADDQDDDDERSRGTANGTSRRNTSAGAGTPQRVPLSPRAIPSPTPSTLTTLLSEYDLPTIYRHDQVVVFPGELAVPAATMRRMADELIWGSSSSSVPVCGASGTCRRGIECDRTYETIRVVKRRRRRKDKEEEGGGGDGHGNTGGAQTQNGGGGKDKGKAGQEQEDDDQCYEIEERRTLTRLENFVPHHDGWSELCLHYLTDLISALCGEPMALYKEKLNVKPPGGSGFAPHLDSPSLRMALGPEGPREFVTVMVAIDDMTVRNGCLRVVKGPHTEENHVDVILPKEDGNPDGDGRAGAIPDGVASALEFEDVVVKGGTIAAFGGWVPHRSAVNASPFARRAVFLTYNPVREGRCREKYYDKMKEMREGWRRQVGLADRQQQTEDERLEMEALASIPKI